MTNIRISEVNVYPVKSCAPLEGQSAEVGELGLKHDRSFMLVDSIGNKVTQREKSKLALVKTAISTIDRETIIVQAPDFEPIRLSTDYDKDAQEINVNLFKKTGTGIVIPDASQYFSEYLSQVVNLVQIRNPRTIKPECQVDGAVTQTGFADGFPFLLTSNSSLAALNVNAGDPDNPIPMNRFRANFVIEGAPAYDEDFWREIRIGNLRTFAVRACARCPMPNVDQNLGEYSRAPAVSRTLQKYRRGIDPINNSRGVFFGQNLTHVYEPGQVVNVGDSVDILGTSDTPNIVFNS